MESSFLKKLASKAPTGPGIYIFTGPSMKKLYIGKASNLRTRLRSYLKTKDPRIQKMLSVAEKVEFKETGSDIEALILESQLVKDFQPQFNIVMRDDKQYFHVGFTHSTNSGQAEKFPKLFLTHQPQGFEAEFIGPFTDGAVLKSTLKFLRKILPYCTCKNPHNNFCLNYHIEKCVGFCCLKKGEYAKEILTDYKRSIRALKEILNGKRKSLLKVMTKEMSLAAKKEDFETAIGIRGKIEGLERIFENARVIKDSHPQEHVLKELAIILKLKNPPFRIEGYDISNIQGTNATGSMVVFADGVPNKNQYRKFKIRNKKSPDDTFMLSEMLQRRFNHPEWKFPDLILIDGGKGQLNAAGAAISKSEFLISKQIQNPKFKIPIISLAKGKYEIFSTTLEKSISMSKLAPNVRNLIKSIDAEAHRFAINYYRHLHKRKLLN